VAEPLTAITLSPNWAKRQRFVIVRPDKRLVQAPAASLESVEAVPARR
jgi:hypothetical protein